MLEISETHRYSSKKKVLSICRNFLAEHVMFIQIDNRSHYLKESWIPGLIFGLLYV